MNISGISPRYPNGYLNGIDTMIMQSDEAANKVIAAFEDAISKGFHPEIVEQDIYRQTGVDPADFTEYDKEKILKRVNEIWESHNNRRN